MSSRNQCIFTVISTLYFWIVAYWYVYMCVPMWHLIGSPLAHTHLDQKHWYYDPPEDYIDLCNSIIKSIFLFYSVREERKEAHLNINSKQFDIAIPDVVKIRFLEKPKFKISHWFIPYRYICKNEKIKFLCCL